MKALLRFELPEEKDDLSNALKGSHYKMLIDDLYSEVFRPYFKFDKKFIDDEYSEHELIQAIWEKVYNHFKEEEE